MNLEVRHGTAGLDWNDICDIFKRAPLGTREPAALRSACENSHTVCTAWDGKTVVGFGRAISDGRYHSAVYDVVVLPEYQGKGVGRTLMQEILAHLPPGRPVLLYAVPGKEAFYRKMGFGNLKTGMGRFPNPEQARAAGYLE